MPLLIFRHAAPLAPRPRYYATPITISASLFFDIIMFIIFISLLIHAHVATRCFSDYFHELIFRRCYAFVAFTFSFFFFFRYAYCCASCCSAISMMLPRHAADAAHTPPCHGLFMLIFSLIAPQLRQLFAAFLPCHFYCHAAFVIFIFASHF